MNVKITGLHTNPVTYRIGTVIRILIKHGATRDDIALLEKTLRRGGQYRFGSMVVGNVKEVELTS